MGHLIQVLVDHAGLLSALAALVISEILPFTKGPTSGILQGVLNLLQKKENSAAPKSKRPKGKPTAFLLLGSFGLTASGCACWGAKANEPACIVAHQSVDCSTDAMKTLIPQGAAILTALFAGQTPDPAAILGALKGFSADAALCIIQAVANDFLRQPRGILDDRLGALRSAESALRFELGIPR
jgi:hypothetical protein